MNFKFSQATSFIRPSAVRDVLSWTKNKDMISLSGGYPAPETFPAMLYGKLYDQAVSEFGLRIHQYGTTEAFDPFREEEAKHLKNKGVKISNLENINVMSGSQQALDILGRIFIDPGDTIVVTDPTYLGALQAWGPYQPRYLTIPVDEEGPIPEKLDQGLKNQPAKFVYLVPTFDNPRGVTISARRREAIAKIIQKHHTVLIEDDPYSELRYEGKSEIPIQARIPKQTVYLNTFSKILFPSSRLGVIVAPDEISLMFIKIKQGVDLFTSTLSQAIAAIYLRDGHLNQHLPQIVKVYQPRREAMLEALKNYFFSGFGWTKPEGGMFVWVEGPKGLDTSKTLYKALDQNVSYVPGPSFYADLNQGKNCFRLNFSNQPPEKIKLGVKILGRLFQSA